MKIVNSDSFGVTIRRLRESKGLLLRNVAASVDIDQAILSKIERGKRNANRTLVIKLAEYFQVNVNDFLVLWLSDRIVYELEDESNAEKAIELAEKKIAYKRSYHMGRIVMLNKFREVLGAFPEIRRAWLFGSFAREENTIESDVDILIDVPRELSFTLFDIAEIQTQLNQFTGRKIDVVMARALKPQVKDRIQNDLKLFYEA